jgi:1,4-alpha-glucan branching enzyme
VRDLNTVYRDFAALHQLDVSADGFSWISHDDADNSTLVFERRARGGSRVLVVCNFTPVPRMGWRIGVPLAGRWRELINTDAAVYGGSGVGNAGGTGLATEAVGWQGQAQSIQLDLPPLATLMLVCDQAS